MEISDRLRCLFSAHVEEQDGKYIIEVPDDELQLGNVRNGETYRVAVLSTTDEARSTVETEETEEREGPKPPVEEGEIRRVEIEDIGEQGDGITRVERGYVIIVPDTEVGQRVEIEITDVQENVAFADVVEELSYYE